MLPQVTLINDILPPVINKLDYVLLMGAAN
jgi:hypothetical protein